MLTPITTLRAMDNGKYDKQFFQLSLKKEYDEEGEYQESILIRYGRFQDFMPCSAMYREQRIYLSAAGVGIFADIKISAAEWIKALNRLGSKERLQAWEEVINKLKQIV